MTKNRHCAAQCVGTQTVTVARPLKTPFLTNKAQGGGGGREYLPDTVTCHLLIKGRTCSHRHSALTITPAAARNNNNIISDPRLAPPPHRLDARADVPSSLARVIQSRDPGRFYALCNLTHAPRALPPSCRRVTGPWRALAGQLTAQRSAAQARCSQTRAPRLAKLARGAISSTHRRP